MDYVSIGKAARLTGLTTQTLRNYANEGKIKHIRTPNGHRRYDLTELLGGGGASAPTTVCYARVSTRNQMSQLDTQRECLAKLYPGCEVVTDIASGLNFNRKGFNSLLERALSGEAVTVVCTYRDRITRFGFDFIERIIARSGGKIVVLNKMETSPLEEFTADLVAIITCFSSRIHGLRSHKNKKIIYEAIRGTEETSETVDGDVEMGLQQGCYPDEDGI
jgi:predicted site-specific integrase-resolvase